MKIIILGVSGMLGHMTAYYFIKKYNSEIVLCSRTKTDIAAIDSKLIKISEYSKEKLTILINKNRPCKIINCVSVNYEKEKHEKLNLINSKLPKLLFDILNEKNDGSHLIHISTNGVFSGQRGDYTELDKPDSINVYGKSKLKGEIITPPHLTIRTSIIGTELKTKQGLLEWFLKQKNETKGYTEVKWNGVTTLECAKFIDWAIKQKINGLVHLFSKKTSKYNLLNLIKKTYRTKTQIIPDNKIKLDLSLNTQRSDLDYIVPDHKKMLDELKNISII